MRQPEWGTSNLSRTRTHQRRESETAEGGRELTLSDRSPFPHIVLITICVRPTTPTAAVACGDAWAEQGGQLQRLVDHLRRRRAVVVRPTQHHSSSFPASPSPSSSFFTRTTRVYLPFPSPSFLSRASRALLLSFSLSLKGGWSERACEHCHFCCLRRLRLRRSKAESPTATTAADRVDSFRL